MSETIDVLILDLLEWVADEPRPYSEVMDAWRTSCPRLLVREDANDRGFLTRRHVEGSGIMVRLTTQGRGFLDRHRRIGLRR